jgi:diguanylate cyclase (GGDEF)-like protein/PAS domain S-box-containing protein
MSEQVADASLPIAIDDGAPGYDPDVYRTLLESTKAIPWKIDWATMRFAYIGPQIEALLGWRQDSWLTVEDWATRMHPDDRDTVVNFCVSQSQAGVDHEADYRAMTKDGDYVWIRDVVHVARNADGGVDSLIGFMFDISERKRSEQDVIRLQKELEALSFEDGLTGIANRRMFDSHLETRFRSAQRSGRPLTLIMLDIDHFKQFNDHYGHIQGDDCLKTVANALKTLIDRPDDLVARYGGEEFVFLLPDTDVDTARDFAGRCMQTLAGLRIAHQASPGVPLVTASLGVGTITPSTDTDLKAFTQAVDRLLYAAKAKGRNRIEAEAIDPSA